MILSIIVVVPSLAFLIVIVRALRRKAVETMTVPAGRIHVLARAERLEGSGGAAFGRSSHARFASCSPLEYPWLSPSHQVIEDPETPIDPIGPLHILRVDDADERMALERATAPGTKLRFAKKPASRIP